MNAKNANTLVVGLGSNGQCDEGFGLHVIAALRQVKLPQGVETLEASGEADLVRFLAGRPDVILIDAVQTNDSPGRFVELALEDFLAEESPNLLHHADIRKTLAVTYLMGCAPRRVKIFGVVPVNISGGNELSDEVRRQVPVAVSAIIRALTNSRS